MFFPERILSIPPKAKVLEVGPGATPHRRSDVFLELRYDDDYERIAQSGHVGILETNKPVVYYDGGRFPFADREFDYVICSHVIEHVPDLPFFLSEVFRVSPKGYLEFPTPLYDYVYDFPEHLNFCFKSGDTLVWANKAETGFDRFRPFNLAFYETLKGGYIDFIDAFRPLFFQGFEFFGPVPAVRATDIAQLVFSRQEVEEIVRTCMEAYAARYTVAQRPFGLMAKLKMKLTKFLK